VPYGNQIATPFPLEFFAFFIVIIIKIGMGSRTRSFSSTSSTTKKKKQPVWLVKTQLWCYEKMILVHLVAMMSLEPFIAKL